MTNRSSTPFGFLVFAVSEQLHAGFHAEVRRGTPGYPPIKILHYCRVYFYCRTSCEVFKAHIVLIPFGHPSGLNKLAAVERWLDERRFCNRMIWLFHCNYIESFDIGVGHFCHELWSFTTFKECVGCRLLPPKLGVCITGLDWIVFGVGSCRIVLVHLANLKLSSTSACVPKSIHFSSM